MKEVSRRLRLALATAIFFVVYGTADASQQFRCTEGGKFLIPESCDEFHFCKLLRRGFAYHRIRCPEGKTFDGVLQKCRRVVTNRPACSTSPVAPPTEAPLFEMVTDEAAMFQIAPTEAPLLESAEIPIDTPALPDVIPPTFDSCNTIQEIIPEIIKTSNELCPHIVAIENYVDELKSGIPISIHYTRDVEHNESVITYNTALANAQHELNSWRNGDSLLSAIKRTYDSVKKFEPDFDHKHGVNAERIKRISSSSNRRTVSRLQDSIEELKEDIQMLEEMLNETDSQVVKATFESQLERKLTNLRTKQQSLKEASGHGPVFEELETFLEMVSQKARDVENNAKETESRMDQWYITLLIVTSQFKSQCEKLEQVMENLKDDANAFEASVAKCQKNIRDFNSRQSNLRSLMSELETKIEANVKEIRDARSVIIKKTLDHEREQSRICEENGIPEEQFTNCSSIFDPVCEFAANLCLFYRTMHVAPLNLTEDHEKLEQLIHVKHEQNGMLTTQINNIMILLQNFQKDINQREGLIEDYRGKIRQTNAELANLRFYSNYQKQVVLLEDSAFAAIKAIISGLQEVHCGFHTLHEGLDGMVAQARTARAVGNEHEEDVLKVKDSIDQHIADVHQIIDQSGDNVSPLNCL